jgi:hypothetical protein
MSVFSFLRRLLQEIEVARELETEGRLRAIRELMRAAKKERSRGNRR